MTILVSTLILLMIAWGWKMRRRPEIHIPCMATAFALDIGLLLYIELNRHAINTVTHELKAPVHNGLLLFHVSVSLLSIVFYLLQIVTGITLYKSGRTSPTIHRRLAYAFAACRLTNYVTSFWLF